MNFPLNSPILSISLDFSVSFALPSFENAAVFHSCVQNTPFRFMPKNNSEYIITKVVEIYGFIFAAIAFMQTHTIHIYHLDLDYFYSNHQDGRMQIAIAYNDDTCNYLIFFALFRFAHRIEIDSISNNANATLQNEWDSKFYRKLNKFSNDIHLNRENH